MALFVPGPAGGVGRGVAAEKNPLVVGTAFVWAFGALFGSKNAIAVKRRKGAQSFGV